MIEIEIDISHNDIWACDDNDDMAYFLRKMKSALMVPKEYLNA